MKTIESVTNLILKLAIICLLIKGLTLFVPIKDITTFILKKDNQKLSTVKNCQTKNKINPNQKEKSKNIYGIDVSHYRLNELKKTSKIDSISFVFIKATESKNYYNPIFIDEWKVATKNRLYKGAYHFYHNNIDPIVQADYFYSKIKHVIDSTTLPPVLDVEKLGFHSKKYVTNKSQGAVLDCLHRIEELTGKTPIVYTSYNFGKHFFTDSRFSKYSLWIADYSKKEQPNIPKPWKDKGWLFWQKPNRYKINTTNIDLNVFNGTLMNLKKITKIH